MSVRGPQQAPLVPPARVRNPQASQGWGLPLTPGGKRSREDAPLAGKGAGAGGGGGAGFTFGAVSVLPPGPPLLQASLRVGHPNTPLEREAEEVAGRVVGQGAAPASLAAPAVIARSASEIAGGAGGAGGAGVEVESDSQARAGTAPAAALGALEGGGAPLPDSERAYFEPRLGHSFAGVRIHTGAGPGAAATRLGARAFTHGSDVAFAPGEYAPQSERGRRLLAHELVHVVQQSQRATSDVQRDLATPPPEVAPAAQPDLTPEQIQSALAFNRQRFDQTRTRLIQDLVGTEPTGVWTEDDVVAIAAIQGEYGLKKDGVVGPDTFRFLDAEVRQEGIPRTDANCLLSFNIRNFGVTDGGTAGGFRTVRGHFQMRAQFSRTCGCPDYEYRQFIRGHAIRRPAGGGAPVDLGPTFTIPGGGLPAAFSEDGDTTAAVLNYGHRADASEDINRYVDASGAVDQAGGCRYEGEDFPGGPFPFAAGDALDIDINFRGEVRRRGRVVQTLQWTAIRGVFR